MSRKSQKRIQGIFLALFLIVTLLNSLPVLAQTSDWPSDWQFPIPGQPITADFGENMTGYSNELKHSGMDIGTGSKPGADVLAANDGKVVMVQDGGAGISGITVCIFHGWDANNVPVSSSYGHTKNPRVSQGQIVQKGQVITQADGFMAKNGVFQPHIHLQNYAAEMCSYNTAIFRDPMDFPEIVKWWDGRPGNSNVAEYYDLASVTAPGNGQITYLEESASYSERDEMVGEFVVDDSIFNQNSQSVQPVSSTWAPENDIAEVNKLFPSFVTDAIETTYPKGIVFHHTVTQGNWRAPLEGHSGENRVPYLVIIDKEGVAHQVAEYGSITYHARCPKEGTEWLCPNSEYVSVSVIGDYRTDVLTQAQKDTMVKVIQWFASQGAANVVMGHRDVGLLMKEFKKPGGGDYGYYTICPGDNIYNELPGIVALANSGSFIGASSVVTMEGEFIVDQSFYDAINKEDFVDEDEFGFEDPTAIQNSGVPRLQPYQVKQPLISRSAVRAVLVISALLFVLGMIVISTVFVTIPFSGRNRFYVKVAAVAVSALACLAVSGSGYYLLTLPLPPQLQPPQLVPLVSEITATPGQTQPTEMPDEFVGTGGGIVMEIAWEDPLYERIMTEDLVYPIVPYTQANPLSRMFWYFAVGQLWGDKLPGWAAEYNLDPNILGTFWLVESGGNPYAHCPNDKLGYNAATDANKDKGLGQLNPAYFSNGCELDSNRKQSAQYIQSRLAASGGNLAAAAAGYNGGPKALEWFMISTDPESAAYKQARNNYITFLNGLGYDGAAKASIVERYVRLIVSVYTGVTSNSTQGLEPFLSPGSYAGKVATAYGLPWPPDLAGPQK